MRVPLVILIWKCEVIPWQNVGVYFRSSECRWRKKEKKTRRLPVIQRSTRRTGQGCFRLIGKLAGHGQSMITIREWFVSGALKTNKQDTTATPGPAQPLFPEREEEEGWWGWSSIQREGGWPLHEGVISDYDESKAEMTEETVLKKLEKELLWNKNNWPLNCRMSAQGIYRFYSVQGLKKWVERGVKFWVSKN